MGAFFLLIAVTAVLLQPQCWALDPTNIYNLKIDQLTNGCDQPNESKQSWCLVDGVIDDTHVKCWVTSYNLCDGRRYAGDKSVCRNDVKSDVWQCKMGRWQQQQKKSRETKIHRMKRWLWGGRRTVHVTDNLPEITCHASITRDAPAGQTTARVTWNSPHVSDDRGAPTLRQIQGPQSGSTFSAGPTLIRYRATDSGGQSAECHFTVTVTVKYCPSPPPLIHGSRTCTGAVNNVYGSTCSHSCVAGYSLHGSHGVQCQSSGSWSSSFPSCLPVSCGPPGSVAGGRAVCAEGDSFRASCVIQCDAGFDRAGPASFSCTSRGVWAQRAVCSDGQAPQFPQGCPADQHVYSGPMRAPVNVTWTDPVATDNSAVPVTLNSVPAKGSALGPGSHSITITSEDVAGNRASCHFTVTVEARECDAVSPPSNGNVTCTGGHVEGSVCSVSCHYGYRLRGQATLSCLHTEKWDAAIPTCEAVICGNPPVVSAGQWACPNGRQCPAVCTLTCAPGYRLVSPGNVTCGQQGNWTSPGGCQDIQAPVFDNGCPANKEVFATRLGQDTRVNLTQPAVSDNSDDVLHLSSDVTSGSLFAHGVTVVTYTAADASGNTNSCHTNVTVIVLDCGDPDLLSRSAQDPSPMQSSCPDGHVHGASCALSCRHGYRLQGQGSVTCERDDVTHPPSMTWQWSGSIVTKPECLEDDCPALEPPKNGALSCYHGNEGWDCYVSCEIGWDLRASSDGRVSCANERRVWTPASVHDCEARHMPGQVRMLAEVLYFSGSCNMSIDQLRHNFIARIRQSVFNGACARITTCNAENIEVTCSPVQSRSRRHLDEDNESMTRLPRFRRHHNMTSHVVRVTFHVTMPYVEKAVSPEEAFQTYQAESHRLQSDLRAKVTAGHLNMNDLDLDLIADGVGDIELQADCPPGTAYTIPRQPIRFSCLAN